MAHYPIREVGLEDWWYAHQRGGCAALHPKARCDRGVPRKLTPEQEQLIVAQARAHPAIPIKVLYRQWKQQDPKLPSVYAIYSALRQHDLSQRSRYYLMRQALISRATTPYWPPRPTPKKNQPSCSPTAQTEALSCFANYKTFLL